MTPLDSCLAIAQKLREAHDAAPSPELDALHAQCWQSVWDHRDLLGLTEADLQAIGATGQGTAQRGGEPKDPPKKQEN